MYTFIVKACTEATDYQDSFCDESCTHYKIISEELQLSFFHSSSKIAIERAAKLMYDSRLKNIQGSYCIDSDNNLIIMAHITHQIANEFDMKYEELWEGDVGEDFLHLIPDLVLQKPIFSAD